MLETKSSWTEWKSEGYHRAHRQGFVLGTLSGRLEVIKLVVRKEKQYQRLLEQGKKASSTLENMHEWYIKMHESEEQRELFDFMEKYPTYSRRQLAKRILWESEYWR